MYTSFDTCRRLLKRDNFRQVFLFVLKKVLYKTEEVWDNRSVEQKEYLKLYGRLLHGFPSSTVKQNLPPAHYGLLQDEEGRDRECITD